MPTGQGTNSLMDFFPFLIILGIFYLLVFKPQKEKQKQLKGMINDLKKNDQVITSGGIHATVISVKENTVIVRIDDNAKMEIDKEAIAVVDKK